MTRAARSRIQPARSGITGGTWLLSRVSRGRLRPPVGWAAVAGVGTIAGIGFAVPILIATLAFTGTALQEVKLGVLTTVIAAPAVTWLVFRATAAAGPAADPCPARHL